MHTFVHVCLDTYIYTYINLHAYKHTSVCTQVYAYMRKCICIHAYTHVHTQTHTSTHTHTHLERPTKTYCAFEIDPSKAETINTSQRNSFRPNVHRRRQSRYQLTDVFVDCYAIYWIRSALYSLKHSPEGAIYSVTVSTDIFQVVIEPALLPASSHNNYIQQQICQTTRPHSHPLEGFKIALYKYVLRHTYIYSCIYVYTCVNTIWKIPVGGSSIEW